MLLLIVRHGATDYYRYLRETFAGEPAYIMWDRRLRERRGAHQRRVLDERRERHNDRRAPESPLSLKRLPFIVIPSPMTATGTDKPGQRRHRLFEHPGSAS